MGINQTVVEGFVAFEDTEIKQVTKDFKTLQNVLNVYSHKDTKTDKGIYGSFAFRLTNDLAERWFHADKIHKGDNVLLAGNLKVNKYQNEAGDWIEKPYLDVREYRLLRRKDSLREGT